MCMIGTPTWNDDKFHMEADSVIENYDASASCFSLAYECAWLCSHEDRIHGVKSHHKYHKCKEQEKLTEIIYHVQEPADVMFSNIKFRVERFLKGNHNGLTTHYNIRIDPDLGVGHVELRGIPCTWYACVQQQEHNWLPNIPPHMKPWCAGNNTKCQWWDIFQGLNNWSICNVVPTSMADYDEVEESKKYVLEY